ncbi:putative MFS family arabinose efflux permease [Micromonospora pisi]|uniref:Putative MFS family arabinose efflux permease n=1 Tax=Micromonospora pisi TaxID=589240 RepID=A0A495JGN1_9ACTN|nr:MFS transporter [Micromonospora pisi]RKR87931.1 putative MFS family arabinose efflux permease [Micromonospora pisi]
MSSTSTNLSAGRSARAHGRGFWAVALAFLAIMALGTLPSPLYPLYQQQDHFSTFTITLIYSAYAAGVLVSLFTAGHISDWHGRRRVLAPAVAVSALSALVFLLWPELPGLVVGRVLGGMAVGVVAATATVWLAELHRAHRPDASPRRAQLVASVANLGGLGLGPLIAGLLAEYAPHPLRLPYVVLLVALALALVGVLLSPDSRELPNPRPRYRAQRISVPAAARSRFYAALAGAFLAYGGLGVLVGLSGTFLAGTLHHPSRALAGAAVFLVFAAGVAVQLTTLNWSIRRSLAVGMVGLVAGVGLLVLAAWLPTPSLTVFLVGGVLTGVGAGALFKGTLGTAVAISNPESRAEALAGLFLAGYLGLSVPVIGIGIALQHVSARVALLGFAVLVTLGVVAVARRLLDDPRPATAVRPVVTTH